MAHFITLVSYSGPFTAEVASQPGPDPSTFGMPTEDDGSRADPMLGESIITITHYEPDFDALRAASTRIVVAAGRAARRGRSDLPSDHGGFLGGEYGQTGDPDAFAAKLGRVLTNACVEAT